MLESVDILNAPIAEVEPLWRVEEVMKYLNCKEVTVWRYMHQHGLPYIKVTRTSPLRFRPESVKNWVAKQEIIEPINAAS